VPVRQTAPQKRINPTKETRQESTYLQREVVQTTGANSVARAGYMDFFGDYNNKEPIILEDGTSVHFPAGWTDEDADKWRKSMDLQRPDGFTAPTCQY
jgi:hypothetical protein